MREKLIAGVEIEKLEDVSVKGDARGPVFEWKEFAKGRIVQVTAYTRRKGSVFGNHFHKGADPSKNPEMFLFISGTAELWALNKFAKEEKKVRVDPGTVVIIRPGVFHKFSAVTDIVQVEPRVTLFDKKNPDTFSADEYEAYQK